MGLLDLLIELQAEREPWRVDAECRGADQSLFFAPRRGVSRDNVSAKELCDRCPVREECLEYALRTGQLYGIWGGMTERERRVLRRGLPRRRRGPALPEPRELTA